MSLNPNYAISKRIKAKITPSVVVATANTTITADQALYGVVVSNIGASGEVIFTLPPGKPGMRVQAIVGAVQLLSIDPNGTEIIYSTAGVSLTAGVPIKANSLGEVIELVCLTAGNWYVANFTGTWTSTGA